MTKLAASILAAVVCLGLASTAQAQHFAPPSRGHYDYHPGHFERHRLHAHYVPGHYDYHPGYQQAAPLPPAPATFPRYSGPSPYAAPSFPQSGQHYPGYAAPFGAGHGRNY